MPTDNTEELDETARILYGMLQENTGRSLCDSGGIPQYDENGKYIGSIQGYGRAYERNQGRDFIKEPTAWAEFIVSKSQQLEVMYTKSVFHHCYETLMYADEMDKLFLEFSEHSHESHMHDSNMFVEGMNLALYLLWKAGILKPMETVGYDDDEEPWASSFEAFQKSEHSDINILIKGLQETWEEFNEEWKAEYASPHAIDVIGEAGIASGLTQFEWELLYDLLDQEGFGGLHGEGTPVVVNTCNHESVLSQTLQYIWFSTSRGTWVLLHIHGGCDVRGNYTKARAFEPDDEFLMDCDGTILLDCPKDEILEGLPEYWYTDDGYHWYPEGCCGAEYMQLEQYPCMDWDNIAEDKFPQDIKDIEEAIYKSDKQLEAMCKRFPDKADYYREIVECNKEELKAEFDQRVFEWLGEDCDIGKFIVIVRDGEAFIQGRKLVAS